MTNSLGSLQGVLHRTSAFAEEEVKQGKLYGPKLLELQLIQSKKDIEHPPETFKAIRLFWELEYFPLLSVVHKVDYDHKEGPIATIIFVYVSRHYISCSTQWPRLKSNHRYYLT